MTKLITIFIILLVLLGAWQLFNYYDRIRTQRFEEQKQAPTRVVTPEELPGMPYQLDGSLKAAESHGPAALGNWLQTYRPYLQDPRLAWIELDYCVMIVRDNPSEAKRIFTTVRERTPTNSPVWPRIQQLRKGYE